MPPSGSDWRTELLAVWARGQQRSMVGPGDVAIHLELAERLARVVVDEFTRVPVRCLDLGSGAGIPGLALAGLWPGSTWTLVDAAQRRVDLLIDGVASLGWADRVSVVHGRAEDLGRDPSLRGQFDVVTSRSFGPPAVAAECGGAFVADAGLLVVTEPPDETLDRWPEPGLAELGLQLVKRGSGVVCLRRVDALSDRFPRRSGVPAKRPLF